MKIPISTLKIIDFNFIRNIFVKKSIIEIEEQKNFIKIEEKHFLFLFRKNKNKLYYENNKFIFLYINYF